MLNEDLKCVTRAMAWVERASPEARRYIRDLVNNRIVRDADEELARYQAEDDARGAGA